MGACTENHGVTSLLDVVIIQLGSEVCGTDEKVDIGNVVVPEDVGGPWRIQWADRKSFSVASVAGSKLIDHGGGNGKHVTQLF